MVAENIILVREIIFFIPNAIEQERNVVPFPVVEVKLV